MTRFDRHGNEKPCPPGWAMFALGLLTGLVLGIGLPLAHAQDVTPTLEVTASHSEAVAGQTVFVSWKIPTGSAAVTRCEFRRSPEGLPDVVLSPAPKSRTNMSVVMPDAPNLLLTLECFYPFGGREVSATKTDLIQRTTREAILAGNTEATCYPAPVGSGTKVYGTSYRDEERRDAACVLWFCGDKPRSFCFRWDLADWSLAGLAAAKDLAGLDAKWSAAPWQSTSERERALVAALFEQARPRYYAAPNGTYTSRPVYARKEDGTRGALVSTSRVAVGDECDCAQRAIYGTTRYCSVAGRTNALRPPELLPGSDTISGGSFALCASR